VGHGPSAAHKQHFEQPEKTQMQLQVVSLWFLLLDLLVIQQRLKSHGPSDENCEAI
jgi:hypothetical protein